MKLATYASVSVAAFLILIKFWAWLETDSVSILSALVDSMLDLVTSAINLFAVRYALMPPDADHRFGHNSAEDVAALGQGAFVAGSATFIAINAFGKLLHPEPIGATGIGITVMAISVAATLALVTFQRIVVKRTGSTAIHADHLHYLSDLALNGSVIVALVLSSKLGWHYADPLFSIAISIGILYGAWHIGRRAFDKLMDKSFPEAEVEKIQNMAMAHPGVLGVHNIKTRYSGIKPFIQFHLELDGTQSLHATHLIADTLEHSLLERYPGGEVIIHQDPRMPPGVD